MSTRHLNSADSDAHDVAPPELPSGDDLLEFTLWLMGFGQSDMPYIPPSAAAFVRHHGIAGLLDSTRLGTVDPPHSYALSDEQRRIALRSLQLGARTGPLSASGFKPRTANAATSVLRVAPSCRDRRAMRRCSSLSA